MKVLVTAASKYGATAEIAEGIGRVLREHGLEADVRDVEGVNDLVGYDAVVLGSGVYAGQWLDSARRFVSNRAAELSRKPTWLFSSGPIGAPPRPSDEKAVDVDSIIVAIGAREHRVFPGRLDKDRLSFGERALVFAFRASEGDFRDWPAIRLWAETIARELTSA